MSGNARLDQERAPIRINPGGKPVERDLGHVGAQCRDIRVVRSQGMPIHDSVVTLVGILQGDPVVEGPYEVPQMKLAGWPHPAEDAIFHMYWRKTITIWMGMKMYLKAPSSMSP